MQLARNRHPALGQSAAREATLRPREADALRHGGLRAKRRLLSRETAVTRLRQLPSVIFTASPVFTVL